MYVELAVFGAILLPVGVIIQFFIPNGLMTGLGIALIPSASFLMIYGTLFYYLGKIDQFQLPDSFTIFSVLVMILGILLATVPVFEPSYIIPLELPGPVLFAYGLVNITMQIQMKHNVKARNIAILSAILLVAGITIPTLLHLFTGSGYLALAVIPAVTGVYILFVPIVNKTFNHWKSMGYFQ